MSEIAILEMAKKEACRGSAVSCCSNVATTQEIRKKIGYTYDDLESDAGIDCLLAAEKVGKNRKVIGVNMTPEIIEKARENAKKGQL